MDRIVKNGRSEAITQLASRVGNATSVVPVPSSVNIVPMTVVGVSAAQRTNREVKSASKPYVVNKHVAKPAPSPSLRADVEALRVKVLQGSALNAMPSGVASYSSHSVNASQSSHSVNATHSANVTHSCTPQHICSVTVTSHSSSSYDRVRSAPSTNSVQAAHSSTPIRTTHTITPLSSPITQTPPLRASVPVPTVPKNSSVAKPYTQNDRPVAITPQTAPYNKDLWFERHARRRRKSCCECSDDCCVCSDDCCTCSGDCCDAFICTLIVCLLLGCVVGLVWGLVFFVSLFGTVKNKSDWDALKPNIISLVVKDSVWSGFTLLDFSRFPSLRRLKIGNNCFMHVTEFNLTGLNKLKKVEIGSSSFTQYMENPPTQKEPNRRFVVSRCPSLQKLTIGRYSFSDYAEFHIDAVQSLEEINVGILKEWSYNFYYASLELIGENRERRFTSSVVFVEIGDGRRIHLLVL